LILLDYVNVFCLFELSALCRAILAFNEERAAMTRVFELVARLDALQAVAQSLEETEVICEPEFRAGRGFALVEGYHPLIEQPVRNTIELTGKSLLLTGTNMAGKTTFIKMLGINAVLARTIGLCFARRAVLPQANVRTLIERADVATSRQSYFYFEAVELLRMMEESKKSGSQFWFVLDEIFRGTNTTERIAAGCAVLRHLNQHGLVIVSTHDHELTALLREEFELCHFSEVIENDKARFDYQLRRGPCLTRNAIKLLGIAGYPAEVTELAGKLAKSDGEPFPKEKGNTAPEAGPGMFSGPAGDA
jgi:DNA mismatch repair ATPase MutS